MPRACFMLLQKKLRRNEYNTEYFFKLQTRQLRSLWFQNCTPYSLLSSRVPWALNWKRFLERWTKYDSWHTEPTQLLGRWTQHGILNQPILATLNQTRLLGAEHSTTLEKADSSKHWKREREKEKEQVYRKFSGDLVSFWQPRKSRTGISTEREDGRG